MDCLDLLQEDEAPNFSADYDFLKRLSSRKGGRYSVHLNWKHNKRHLRSNEALSLSFMTNLAKRMEEDPKLFERYAE